MNKIIPTKIAFILFFIAFLFQNSNLYAQNFFFDIYSVKEGLGHTKVKSIVQTEDGFIWLGTASGLSKFDGEKFTNFTIEDGISPFGISTLHIDTTGSIWIGHLSGGLSLWRNDKFMTINLDSIKGDITDIAEDSSHAIWVSTSGSGVYKFENPYGKGDDFKKNIHITAKQGLDNIVFSMSKNSKLGMFFVTRYGVKFFNSNINKYEFVNDQFFAWPQYFNIIKVVEDQNHGIWVGTFNGGLYYYEDLNTKPVVYDKRDGLANNFVSDIYPHADGSVWVATFGGGISHFENGKIINFDELNGLPDNKINCISGDLEGNVLLGTYSKGLAIFKTMAFVNFQKFSKDKALQVQSIVEAADNEYWIGTNEGLFYFNPKLAQDQQIKSFYKDGVYLQSNDIRFVKKDIYGHIWIGTWGGGISYFDAKKQKFVYPYLPNDILSRIGGGNANVTALEFDKEGNLWIGSYDGLIYYETQNDKIDILTQGNNLQNNDISALFCDAAGVLWVGHRDKGLSKIVGAEISHYDFGIAVTPISIYGINNELWLGTEGMGIFRVADNKIIDHFSIDNGLMSNMVTSINADKAGNIYAGTNRGLNKISLNDKSILSFDAKDGFIGIEVKPNALYFDSKGYLWSGTATGLTRITVDDLKINELPPVTNIVGIKVNLQDRPLTDQLVLNYNEKSILIDYKAICISDASKVMYKVRLLGAETEWQPVTQQTYANYPALPPGKYTFEVKAQNNSSIWNEEAQTFSFTIEPPFWQTIWFYTIVIVVLVVGVVLFVKVRERQLIIEKAALENKVQERTVEIQLKNDLLAKKNKDITDSINYAKRIQGALMPNQQKLKEVLKSVFIYYKPKDIVSGDFHWNTFHNGRLIVAAADCTGHGVPGAFMSMISISSLNKVVKEKQIVDPAAILDNMRADIVNDLKQSSNTGQSKDGLDIALLSIEPEKRIVHFAGAYNALYVVKAKPVEESTLAFDYNFTVFNDRLIEIKADRMPIGISERMNTNFTTKTIQLEQGDSVFISTDGYIDQFGGEKGKKFMSKRFKELLLDLSYADEDKSLQRLDNEFLMWRGKHEQIDDVLVIGISF